MPNRTASSRLNSAQSGVLTRFSRAATVRPHRSPRPAASRVAAPRSGGFGPLSQHPLADSQPCLLGQPSVRAGTVQAGKGVAAGVRGGEGRSGGLIPLVLLRAPSTAQVIVSKALVRVNGAPPSRLLTKLPKTRLLPTLRALTYRTELLLLF